MIHEISSTDPRFKNLRFKPGFNLLVAKRHASSTDRQTRNRAGKSSLIQIVHFLLGGKADLKSIFRNSELADFRFGMDFDLGAQRVTVERSGSAQGRTLILKGDTLGWPVQPSDHKAAPRSLSTKDWRAVLGKVWFRLDPSEQRTFSPTFRSLVSYFARREADGGIKSPHMQSGVQQVWDQQVAISYLLELDWTLGSDWQKVREREKTLGVLMKAAEEGALGEAIPSSAVLRTRLAIAERGRDRLRQAISQFSVLPEYHEVEREASALTQQLNSISNENALDQELLDAIMRAVGEEKLPDALDLERLYSEAGVTFPDTVKRRFDEVQRFHDSVVANRRRYLEAEQAATQGRLERRRADMVGLDRRRAELMRLLQSKGALDQFQQLQQRLSRTEVEVEGLQQRFDTAQKLEGVKTELVIERGKLFQRLQLDLREQDGKARRAIELFEDISNALYDEAGSLTLSPTDNGLQIAVHIQGKRSKGIHNMQIFCFDLMMMRLCADRGIGPQVLIHDSHIFDGVDERQIGKALYVGAETARKCGWQYIVTMNEDDLPRSLPTGFDLSAHMLPVRLTDETEDGGLFGVRFN